jgi:hypothetical protein
VGDLVSIRNTQSIHYVAHVERDSDGPIDHAATRIAFIPLVDHIESGIRTELSSGQLTDDGLRAHVAVNLDRLLEMKSVSHSEAYPLAMSKEPSSPLAAGLARLVHGSERDRLQATVQVPVVDSAHVDGEWVIPKNGVLVVALGPRTGNPGSRWTTEELVMIGYRPTPDEAPTPASPSAQAQRPLRGPAAN